MVWIEHLDVKFEWLEVEANFNEITAYQVIISDDQGDYIEEPIYCDASEYLIVATRWCKIPEIVLRSEPYNLAFDTMIEAKVKAWNINGWGEYSDPNTSGALIQIEPI